jgi:hypothetical protein
MSRLRPRTPYSASFHEIDAVAHITRRIDGHAVDIA